jgi:hypothetical protein
MTELTTNNNIYKFELRNIFMRKLQSLVAVPHRGECVPPKRVFFGQLLVETKCSKIDFAKDVANGVIFHAEGKGAGVDYNPNGTQFVTKIDGNEHIMDFEGDLPAYLNLSGEDACSFQLSFREADDADKQIIKAKVTLRPSYVLTVSVVATRGGELEDHGFVENLGEHIFGMLSEPKEDGSRPGDPEVRMSSVLGKNETYQISAGTEELVK